jgi:hypothetical protein
MVLGRWIAAPDRLLVGGVTCHAQRRQTMRHLMPHRTSADRAQRLAARALNFAPKTPWNERVCPVSINYLDQA